MKIHIYYPITEGPYGGGNQFLKALKKYWERKNLYAEWPERAAAILFNSFDKLRDVVRLRRAYPEKIFIHRVDGPISLVRGRDEIIDKEIFLANHLAADGTIFQSRWCRNESHRMGMKKNVFETIIYNAPDPEIFNIKGKAAFDPKRKIRLIASSWSTNKNKGFDTYRYLDEHLDFSKFDITFVGRSPFLFKHIRMIDALPSEKLAQVLKLHDIFITASKTEPCSNALIEALSCGLPALALNSGGHPELVGKGGELFERAEEIPDKLNMMAAHYDRYRDRLPKFSLEETAERYFNFANTIYNMANRKEYVPKKITSLDIIRFGLKYMARRTHQAIQRIIRT